MLKVVKESEVAPNVPAAISNGRYYLLCPGCYEEAKRRFPDEGDAWLNGALHCFGTDVHSYNQNPESPTLTPSLLCSHTRGDNGERYVCHSFVNAGRIQFLNDCTHPLVGQTVELMDCTPLIEREKAVA